MAADKSQVANPTVRKVLRSFEDYKRLIDLVIHMAREMERLDEDNRQLRAALGMYREVERRGGSPADRRKIAPPEPLEMPRPPAVRARAKRASEA